MTKADLAERHTITVPEFAEMLGISTSSAYEAARRNEIPARRIGSRWVVPVVATMRWLDLEAPGVDATQAGVRGNVTPLRDDRFTRQDGEV